MFDFFDDLFCELNKKTFRYQVFDGKKIVVEGYKNILLITDQRIVLKLYNGEIEVNGNCLKVKELGQNTLIATGEIFSVLTERKNNGK